MNENIRRAMARQSVKLTAAQLPDGVDAETKRRVSEAVGLAFLRAFRVNMIAAGVIAAASSGGAAIIQQRRRSA